jgi:prepilin-type N-terminal cleavage/methylation domain-containing protein
MQIKLSSGKEPSGIPPASGFTLVEVLTAAAIAAVIFMAVFASVSVSFGLLTTTRQNLRATQIMVSRLEGLRLEAWDTTNGLTQLFNSGYVPTNFTESFYPLGLNGTTNDGISYYGQMAVSQLGAGNTNVFGNTPPSYATSMAIVTVTLKWTNSTTGLNDVGKIHTRTMSTLVAQYGLQNYVFAAQ